ncbi:MAG TPA: DUF1016 N-terminal domain-containing protein, partial [Chlamydiales bacterium]|nr:DUF1016 N-terminal domain-containing protein [Chlamydiales bacterium]
MSEKTQVLDGNAPIKMVPEDYEPVLETIVSKIRAAQARAISAVNFELVTVYRDIGQIIHEKQSRVEWGTSVVERLATDLRNLFPKTRGFSSRNLWIMRDLYISYRDHEKLQTLSAEISWSHNVAILSKCQDRLEREFYIRMSKRNGWSYRALLNHIENKSFERNEDMTRLYLGDAFGWDTDATALWRGRGVAMIFGGPFLLVIDSIVHLYNLSIANGYRNDH